MTDTLYIDNGRDLERLLVQLRTQLVVAVDTEFIRERTYYPRACLFQVATDQVVACIDALSIPRLDSFFDLLLERSIIKVLHSARQDLEVIYQHAGQVPSPIFDTQVAAGFCGHAAQIGYGQLVAKLLEVELDKAHTRTDWSRRPLAPEQLSYAADDVRYLVPLYARLERELVQRERLAWLESECALLTDTALYAADPDEAWRRIKSAGKLAGRPLEVLRSLAAWREREAMRRNKPRQWLVRDQVLADVAQRLPPDRRSLEALPGVPPAVVRRHGEAIVDILAGVRGGDEQAAPRQRLGAEQQRLLRALVRLLQERGREQELSPTLLATRQELKRLVLGDRDLPVLRDWRYRVVGEDLLAVLSRVPV